MKVNTFESDLKIEMWGSNSKIRNLSYRASYLVSSLLSSGKSSVALLPQELPGS